MIKKVIFLILTSISITLFGQSPADLNKQAKGLIELQKFDEAVPILKQAAELGSAESQYNLGYCYQVGIGIERNNEKALEWFSKSAEQGYNDALYQLMMAYGSGNNGVGQDFNKAFSYALRCAKNGDETCMFNLISCYKDGTGTERDISKMLEWAIRLGKIENPENLSKSGYITSARLNLAYLYRDGIDIQQDSFKSYQWFLIFNENKKDFSFIQQQQVVKEVQELEQTLSTDQKRKGQIEAENILGRPLKNMGKLYEAEL